MIEAIRSAAPGSVVYDRGEKLSVAGLHCRVVSETKKSFFLFYRTRSGQQRRPKIGDFGPITVAGARKRAKDILELVAQGHDPKGNWDRSKAEPTMSDLFEAAWTGHWNKPRFINSGWAKDVKRFWEKDLKPAFCHAKASTLGTHEIRKWHRQYENDGPYSGNRALEVLSKIFSYGEEEGLTLVEGPDKIRRPIPNPCKYVKPHAEQKRGRFASEDEIRKIVAILERETPRCPENVAFLYSLLLSGSRPKAIADATYDDLTLFEVDGYTWGKLVLKGKTTEKTGDDDAILLPPKAMAVILALPRRIDRKLIGRKMPQKLWTKIKKEVGCTDLWARDMRRTFATVGLSSGVELSRIGELLNHKGTQTTKIYAKLMDESRVQAVSAIANRMKEIVESNVVPLKSSL